MAEWESITKLNVKIPEDEPEVTRETYKSTQRRSGIYKIFNQDEELMYVGQTTNIRRRLYEHFYGKRKGYFIEKVRYFYVDYNDEFIEQSYLNLYETYLIRDLKPRYNVHQTAPMRYLK
ncbi:GIY-YIG nuclease family protein [Halobacillus naozhouensis]|uniref:GIY-YIG nuclease family protein n=1 Tax=Halobacillus naozhouensis TaxID=554880 RepID=A0ABY8J3G1_9BACI|nr:GIY-YIG nuclease family protein [Halobacillus naozhouensis]WFT75938.1 GIY-YIG nuclease family protein [Halobacillus naozhouensis]